MPAVPFALGLYIEQAEVINMERIVNERTNEQFFVFTLKALKAYDPLDSPCILVRRDRAPKKKAKNSQNCLDFI